MENKNFKSVNEKDLRILFMGTPQFAVGVLERLLQVGIQVVGVVTAPDKPAGRGKKIKESAVKAYASAKQLTIFQPTILKDPVFLEELKSLDLDLIVVVAFRMLPQAVWKLPKRGTFNLHASLLPAYRGAAPINWAIINGEEETGVTTFFIEEKIDTGAIIASEKQSIAPCDTAGTLHDKLLLKGADLVLETIKLIAKGKAKTIKQPHQSATLAPKLNKSNTKVDWQWPLEKVYNFIRGLSPYPTAWSTFESGGTKYNVKLYHVRPEYISHQLKTGKIITDKSHIKVACNEGFLYLDQIQLPGKKAMDAKSLLNGFQFSVDAQML